MSSVTEGADRWPRVFALAGVPLLSIAFVTYPACSQEAARQKSDVQATRASKDESAATPTDAYRSYLNAVKNNDHSKAKRCWWISGNDSCGALDVVVGMWVASHRVGAAMSKAGIDGKQFGDFIRDDCTDKAIDRTLARLEHSDCTVEGGTARLTIRWKKDDGYPNPAFFYGDGAIPFRKIGAGWKIDASAVCGIEKPQDLFAGDWGEAFRSQMVLANEVAAGLESKKLKTAADVVRLLEKHVGSLEGRIPLTKTIVYLEDSPARYLRIRKGDPNTVAVGGGDLPVRKDIPFPRSVEGDLNTVFQEIYRHPKIVVETKNKKGYQVVFNPDDKEALRIVAEQLGMTAREGEREILALRITVAAGGHHLKRVAKPEKPQWECCVIDSTPHAAESHWVWPLHGVSMDELALFLESRLRRPVVNLSGLKGYYWLDLSDETVRLWPQRMDETKELDQTGLQLHWEQTKTTVLVVKDK